MDAFEKQDFRELISLAFSQNQIRALKGSRYRVSEVHPQNAPGSLAEALKYDLFEKQLQFHPRTPATVQGKRGPEYPSRWKKSRETYGAFLP
jgi:hypothetical protein